MAFTTRTKYLVGAAGLFGLMAVWNFASFDIELERKKMRSPEVNPVPKPEVVKTLAMGMDAVIADAYWIAAVNYFGSNDNERVCYGQLSDYMRLVTTLAPNFESAYRFAGLSIPCNDGKQWHYVDEANAFMLDGETRFPNNYMMRLVHAYYLSALKNDYAGAEAQLVAASRIPGCPPYAAQLATRMRTTAGDLDGATRLAQQLIEDAPNDSVRDALRRREQEIETLKRVNELNRARVEYENKMGQPLKAVADLVSSGIITKIPEDPLGGEFLIDGVTKEVMSSQLHDRLVLFNKP